MTAKVGVLEAVKANVSVASHVAPKVAVGGMVRSLVGIREIRALVGVGEPPV